MNKFIFFIIIMFILNTFLYTLEKDLENNNVVIENQYSVIIVPFIDNSSTSEYNHLNNVIQNALKAELEKIEKFIFLDENKLGKSYLIKQNNKKEINVKHLKRSANNLNAHILIFGNYEIFNEEITIEVNIANIYYEQKVEKIIFKGSVGIDLFRIIDDTVRSISERIVKKIQRSELVKDYEFSIGFGVSHCGLVQFVIENDAYFGARITTNMTVSLPVSFTFYLNNNFGIGLTYEFGIGYYLFLNLNFTNKLKLLHKIGNIKKRKFVVLEYGVSIDNGLFYNFQEHPNIHTLFYVGPTLFIGYEMQRKRKSVIFSTGVYFEGLYGSYYEINAEEKYLMPHWNFNFGVEFRWRFGFINKK